MTTTHLFVELLVIGFGALAWVVILAAAIFGYDLTSLKDSFFSLGTLFPILSLVYVFGILTDRVADWIFERIWGKRHLQKVYEDGGKKLYYQHRRLLVIEGPELWHFIEYGRSRLRICRGWTLNSALLLIAVSIYAIKEPEFSASETIWAVLFLCGLTVLCWASWNRLNLKEYKKTQRQAEWLAEYRKKNTTQEVEISGSLNLERNEEYEPNRKGPSSVPD